MFASPKHAGLIKHAKHAAAICAQREARGQGRRREHAGAATCRRGSSPAAAGGPPGQRRAQGPRAPVRACEGAGHLPACLWILRGGATLGLAALRGAPL